MDGHVAHGCGRGYLDRLYKIKALWLEVHEI